MQNKDVEFLPMILFYHNRYHIYYKFIGGVIYTFLHNDLCLDYLGIVKKQLSLFYNTFVKTKFNYLPGLVIPEIFLNIMTRHGYARSPNSSVILSCVNALVPYYK